MKSNPYPHNVPLEYTNQSAHCSSDVKVTLHQSPANYGRVIKDGKQRATGTKQSAFKNRLKKRRNKKR
jgi:hypothetical protein